MSREDKRRTNSRMAFRDNRLLSEMLNNLVNEELADSNKSRINTVNEYDENLTRYNTVTTNMYQKRHNREKINEEV